MKLENIIKVLFISIALGLLTFAVFGKGIFDLLKFLALFLGFGIVFIFLYPEIRGVRKGDKVVVSSLPPGLQFFIPVDEGIAMSNGKKKQEIRIKFPGGREAIGIVESYESFFSPAKVSIIYEEKLIE